MKINLTIEPDQLYRAWIVYTLKDAHGTIQYVGHCRLSQLSGLPDARANSLFRYIFPPGRPLTVDMVHIGVRATDARNFMWQWIQEHGRPFMLLQGIRAGQRGVPLVCNETGEVFDTISAACEAHGVAQSAISNHLANRPGFATVKGKTYARGKHAVRLHAQKKSRIPAVLLPT